jgi:hypothetical protein
MATKPKEKEKEITLTQKLCDIQGALNAPKGQTNAFGKYKYRSCEDILQAVKPLLTARGCVLTITDALREVAGSVYVESTASIGDDDAGERCISVTAYARLADERKGMDQAQLTGSCSSYSRKYALNGLLAIDDCKDADTMDNRASGAKPAPKIVIDVDTKTPADRSQAGRKTWLMKDLVPEAEAEIDPNIDPATGEPFDDGKYDPGAVYAMVKKSLAEFCDGGGYKKSDVNNWIRGQYGGRTIAKMQNDDGLLIEVLQRVKSEYTPMVGDNVAVGGVIPGKVVTFDE